MSEIFLNRLKQFDNLIKRNATGTPTELAKKMRISVRCVHKYVSLMKKNGVPIRYCRKNKTYMYSKAGAFYFGFYSDES